MYWIDDKACTGCLACLDACPTSGALVVRQGRPFIDTAFCTECGACVEACPCGAIVAVQPAGKETTVPLAPQVKTAATGALAASRALERTRQAAATGLPLLARLFGARRGIGASPGRFGAGQCRRNRRGGGQRGRPARNW